MLVTLMWGFHIKLPDLISNIPSICKTNSDERWNEEQHELQDILRQTKETPLTLSSVSSQEGGVVCMV